MRIVIVGPGALGTIFAAALSRAGHDVALLGHSSKWFRAIQANGLRLERRDGSIDRVPAAIIDDPSNVVAADAVIVLVKTIDTMSAVGAIKPYLRPGVAILTLQNGLGASAVIRHGLGDEHQILPGTTSQAGRRVEPNLVVHTGEGPTLIGYDCPVDTAAAADLARVFSQAGLPAVLVHDIERWIWHKAAISASINGLTAVGEFPNGTIVAQDDLLDAAETVAEEAAAVARALGIELGNMRGAVKETATATAANRSSMLQDLEAGRRTEVEAIHGAIVAAGVKVGVATPTVGLLAALLRAKTQDRENDTEERISG